MDDKPRTEIPAQKTQGIDPMLPYVKGISGFGRFDKIAPGDFVEPTKHAVCPY